MGKEKKEKKEVRIKKNAIRPRVFCSNTTSKPIGFLSCGEHLTFRPQETKSITAKQADFIKEQKLKGLKIVDSATDMANNNKALIDEIASQDVVIKELEDKLAEATKYAEEKDVELANVKVSFDKLTAELAKAESELADSVLNKK